MTQQFVRHIIKFVIFLGSINSLSLLKSGGKKSCMAHIKKIKSLIGPHILGPISSKKPKPWPRVDLAYLSMWLIVSHLSAPLISIYHLLLTIYHRLDVCKMFCKNCFFIFIEYNLSVYVCEVSYWKLKLKLLTLTPHKNLYL